jgi:hypothetical protein
MHAQRLSHYEIVLQVWTFLSGRFLRRSFFENSYLAYGYCLLWFENVFAEVAHYYCMRFLAMSAFTVERFYR